MSNHRIITNKYKVDIDKEAFLQEYRLFKVYLTGIKSKHQSVYRMLEYLHMEQPNNAVSSYRTCSPSGERLEKDEQARVYLIIAHRNCAIHKVHIKQLLNHSKCDFTIEEVGSADLEEIPDHHLMNLLLALLPNVDQSISYANGKLIIGSCNGWNSHHEKRGEYKCLQIFFDSTLALQSHTITFTAGHKFNSKDSRDKKRLTSATPYYVTFDDKRAYVSTVKQDDSPTYYAMKPSRFRNKWKNNIEFLNIENTSLLHGSQAYVLNQIVHTLRSTFKSFLQIEQLEYAPHEIIRAKEGKNTEEKPYMDNFKNNFWVDVIGYQPYDLPTARLQQKIRKVLTELGIATAYTEGKQRAVIRVMPSWIEEKKRYANDPPGQLRQKEVQSKHKLEILSQSIPVQDITLDAEAKLTSTTLENTLRQLAIKYYCLNQKLPRHIGERYAGCILVCGKKIKTTHDYQVVMAQVNADGSFKAKCATYPGNKGSLYIDVTNGLEIKLAERFDYNYPDSIYFMKQENIECHLFDSNEFVFPVLSSIERELREREKEDISPEIYERFRDLLPEDALVGRELCQKRIAQNKHVSIFTLEQDMRELARTHNGLKKQMNKIRRECTDKTAIPNFKNKNKLSDTYSSYVDIHYWKINEKRWCYAVGTKSLNLSTTTCFDTKTHIRHIETNIPVDSAFIKKFIIDALQDGWLRISNYSVHPSIYKFLDEMREMKMTEWYAKGRIDLDCFLHLTHDEEETGDS